MKEKKFKECDNCGALLDPNQICICKREEAPEFDSDEVYDDWQMYKIEIEPYTGEVFTLMYNGEKEPPKQWDAFSGDNGFGTMYNCTLQDALTWICDLGFIPKESIDFLLGDIEREIREA